MKKFIAVIFLMIYGLTSVSASGGTHLCGNKSGGSMSHPNSCVLDHHSTCCSSGTQHEAANFCKDDYKQCSIENDSSTTEPPTQKLLVIDPAFAFSYNGDEAKHVIPTRSLSSWPHESSICKIRLHLYNRILLI